MSQLELVPRARAGDPHTSHDAAASVCHLSRSRSAVLACLRERGPATDEALADHYAKMWRHRDWPEQSPSGLRTRRAELATAGLVFDTGLRAPLASGRHGIVWGVFRAVSR